MKVETVALKIGKSGKAVLNIHKKLLFAGWVAHLLRYHVEYFLRRTSGINVYFVGCFPEDFYFSKHHQHLLFKIHRFSSRAGSSTSVGIPFIAFGRLNHFQD
jgi:hypothetical protein